MSSIQIPNLTLDDKWERLNYFSDKTMRETRHALDGYGRVLIVRPTGFGKTRLLVNLAKEYIKERKKRVLYVYPMDVIKTEIFGKEEYMSDGVIKSDVDFIAYNTLTIRSREVGHVRVCEEWIQKYSLIILDEVHRAGSEGFMELYDIVKEVITPQGLHMVGATATPNRMTDTEDFNILNNIFDGHTVSEFSLTDSVMEGIMPKPVYGSCEYNIEDVIDTFKKNMKDKCIKGKTNFDEESFNIEISKTIRDVAGAPRFIYRYIKKAGYDISDSSNSYYKFIVFFNNIQDMVDRGETIENWFKEAYNIVGKKEHTSMRSFKFRTFYVASDDTEDKAIQQIVKSSNGDKHFLKKADKLNGIKEKSKTVDLLFTVNMINMGYHVKGITGVALMRGTKSEIVYYQQIGRCLSVKATKSPIVLDFVNNVGEKFRSKNERKKRESALADVMGTFHGSSEGREVKDWEPMDMFITEDEDSIDRVLERFSDIHYSDNMNIKWMYESRNAPICVIAADTNKTCKEIVNILIKMGATIKKEDAMYQFIENEPSKRPLMIFIVSNKALAFLKSLPSKVKTIFDILKKA